MRPALERQAKLLHSELLGMTSLQLQETVQPLRDVIDSMQGWMLRMETFMVRVEAALGERSMAPPVLRSDHALRPLVVPVDTFEVGMGAELHGRFFPRVCDAPDSVVH